MTSDYYEILGVAPSAENVVIRAAYRALIRHYHPDTNQDPEAQARARAITEAYRVLRNPDSRADYDVARAAERDFWAAQDAGDLAEHPPPPAMRRVGIAAALIAALLVGAVWALPQRERPAASRGPARAVKQIEPASEPVFPVVELEPQAERLARLRDEVGVVPPPIELAPPPAEIPIPELALAVPEPPPSRRPMRTARAPAPAPPAIERAAPKPKAATVPNQRVADLDRMSAGFFSQSMVHASSPKKELLMAARDRAAERRKACRSDGCIADSYVRQIRETSAIMEARSGPPK